MALTIHQNLVKDVLDIADKFISSKELRKLVFALTVCSNYIVKQKLAF